jgi:predicted  nucleic acid-binding Zn-ribbon protein
MLQDLEQLLVLQDRDRKIRTMRAELAAAPSERKQLENRLATAGAHLERVKKEARELEVERKRLEVEAQSKRDSIGRFKVQQFQTKKNEEFQALANEIERFTNEVEKIEDRELELMEKAEAVKGQITEAETAANLAQQQVRSQIADLEQKIKSIEERIDSLNVEREKIAGTISEDVLDRYQRLFKSKGDSAVVALRHEVCMGCHMKITTQTAVRVKGGNELVSCEQCGRILYHED